ncbi:MAG TPA: ECF-type sigma factor, partial [Pirellulaceae bacterium]|nr:ECF-type sigma factor [Pirellulaceae bacterium]
MAKRLAPEESKPGVPARCGNEPDERTTYWNHWADRMSEISRILEKAKSGDKSVQDELLALVYGELRRMAAAKIRNQPPGITLGATALVHEAWMRLAPNSQMPAWNSRGHFFSAAAEAMRRVLIDAARRRKSR